MSNFKDDNYLQNVKIILNNITENEIEIQGEIDGIIRCSECSYETGYMPLNKAVFKVNMQGGYFIYDGNGGSDTKCPICEHDRLCFMQKE